MKDLTSSVYTFEKLIEGNYLYIDKTEYIWKLISTAYGQYFMSRPRRFGKSLTVSTLEAVFSGRKELFEGLALYDKKYDWKTYPIIHLDLGNCDADSPETLATYLHEKINELAAAHNLPLVATSLSMRFSELIKALADNAKVVVLIDEYDKPILGNALNPEVEDILAVLKGFYSAIKNSEPHLRFVFMTGVSKFSHVSVFSDLNNLTDITMDARYATMFGYTQQELEENFADRIDAVAAALQQDRAALLAKVKEWYNGYRFEEHAATVYNPVSVAQFFESNGKFKNYWFSTGTPTFLMNLIKAKRYDFQDILNKLVSPFVFDAYEIDKVNPTALLLQTGYLTIKEELNVPVPYTNETVRMYQLAFPNREVSEAFETYLLNAYTGVDRDETRGLLLELVQAVGSGKVDDFMRILRTLFARVPYHLHLKDEHYYQTIVCVIFDLLGLYVEAESQTNAGRIDAMVAAGEWIYVIEFKLNKTAEEALSQIQNKEYAVKFQHRGKRVVTIGVNFDFDKGQITDWVSEEVAK